MSERKGDATVRPKVIETEKRNWEEKLRSEEFGEGTRLSGVFSMEVSDEVGCVGEVSDRFLGDTIGRVVVALPTNDIDESFVFEPPVYLRVEDFGNFILEFAFDFDRWRGIDFASRKGIADVWFEEGNMENVVEGSERGGKL